MFTQTTIVIQRCVWRGEICFIKKLCEEEMHNQRRWLSNVVCEVEVLNQRRGLVNEGITVCEEEMSGMRR